MAKERVVKATFSNGEVLERGSVSKVYTHAWYACGRFVRPPDSAFPIKSGAWNESGFATSLALAEKALRTATSWREKNDPQHTAYTGTFAEAVPVEVIEKRTKVGA